MELVTEPVIHEAKDASNFAKELQLLLRTLGVSDANMEKGEMRVEANVSISPDSNLGTKVEVKNLNSFKSVEGAILYEIKRQAELLEKGETVVQETRGWDENRSKTFSQRVKETADDYRYFPDPDIPKVKRSEIAEFEESRIDEITPELPTFKRDNYKNLGLASDQIEVIIASNELDSLFKVTHEKAGEAVPAKTIANYLTSDLVSVLDASEQTAADVNEGTFANLLGLVSEGLITSRVAKDLLPEVVFTEVDVKALAEEKGLLQSNSEEDLLPIVESIIANNTPVVEEFKAGKEASLKFLVGQGMKETRGSANPLVLEKLLKEQMK